MPYEFASDFINNLYGIAGEHNVKLNEPMAKHTSFKIGGSADVLVTPEETSQIERIVQLCKDTSTPYIVIGNGSNLLVRDKGIRGVVIKTFDKMNKCYAKDDKIFSQSGALMSKLANLALEHELTGLEFASGIPGTVGGAVVMNAGAYGPEMKDVVLQTTYMDNEGNIKTISNEEHRFGYRTSILQEQGSIVLETVLGLKKGNRDQIKALMDELSRRRRESQPLDMPSAGSVFKRPEGYFAGKLIQDCGLKGFCIGGAQVCEKHCGFIINTGNATAKDVENLIKYIQQTVKEKFGVELKTEVKIVGEDGLI